MQWDDGRWTIWILHHPFVSMGPCLLLRNAGFVIQSYGDGTTATLIEVRD